MTYKRKKEYYSLSNKDIKFRYIKGIEIENFRLFEDEKVDLGKNITVFSGRNGSMKSTIIGLISHIYRTENKDIFNKVMQTKANEIFRLSLINDSQKYRYYIYFEDNNQNLIKEPVEIYTDKTDGRHRIVPSGHGPGDGFFNLSSIYLNLKRLYPLIDIPTINEDTKTVYTELESSFISNFYEKILLRPEFNEHEHFVARKSGINKAPIGPKNSYYSVDALSSGEDNLAQIVNILISFMRIYDKDSKDLVGILSIDEFDSSLHPIAQLNLFKFLLKWSKRYKVQILINTHSLYLLKEILFMEQELENENIVVNFISNGYKKNNKLSIIKNPDYNIAVKELTLKSNEQQSIIKLQVYVEDELASFCLKRILKSRNITSRINIISRYNDVKDGISWSLLKSFANNFGNILKDGMCIIVFDQDVDLNSVKNYKYALKFPSLCDSLIPFEKELIRYILEKDAGDEFFKKQNITKESLKQEFSENDISLSIDKFLEDSDSKKSKKWFAENISRNKKFLTYMINERKDIYDPFKLNLIDYANELLIDKNLPIIKE